METKSTTFGEPLLHAEVVLLNRTSIVDLAVAVGQLSCHSALNHTVDKQNNHIRSPLIACWGDFEPGILLHSILTLPLLFFAFQCFLTFGAPVSLWHSPGT